MIEFPKYSLIKDRYCVCYFGLSNEYILQLNLLKPIIEERHPGIQIFIGCRDNLEGQFFENKFMLKFSDLRSRRLDFGYIRELTYNGKNHPVEMFALESGLENYVVCKEKKESTSRCVILSQGNYPTNSLNQLQVEKLTQIARQQGFDPEINASVKNSGLVMGVESVGLFEAASMGIPTRLVPTGVGAKLYLKMFPQGEIVTI